LSRTFAEIRRRRNPGIKPAELAMTWRRTMRAPTLIAIIARLTARHPRVPLHEQFMSIGAAAHGLLLAAQAMGFGAIILSGNRAGDPLIHAMLALEPNERVVGFASIGTPAKAVAPKSRPAPEQHLSYWGGSDLVFGKTP
jgi:nitroreductase